MWCWRRLLRVPWTARRSNQSILKKISPECSLKGLMVKLQYFGHLMQRANSLEKTLMLGKIEDKRRKGWQKMRWLDGITDSMDMCFSKLWGIWRTGKAGVLQSMGSQRVGHDWETFTFFFFTNESVLCIRWPKYWSFSFSISPKEYSGLISIRIDWFDLLAVQGTFKSLLQHHSLKASILWCSDFFMVQLSHPYMTTGKIIALTRWTSWQSNAFAF